MYPNYYALDDWNPTDTFNANISDYASDMCYVDDVHVDNAGTQ